MSMTSASPVRPPPGTRPSANNLGIAYMAAGMFLFSAVDMQAKVLTETFHPVQIVWTRQRSRC